MTDAADNPELLSLRYVDIDTLSAWDRNAKKHDFGALVESIVRHGFRDPPAYDSALNNGAGGVAEGNGRADALRMMRAQQMQPPRGILLQDGRWFAPVLFGVDSASQAAAEAYAVAHNNLTMAGGDFTDLDMSKMWDSVGYADLLADLARQGESPVTIDESALDALLAALAPLPEIGQGGDAFDTTPDDGPTRTALGELWLIGGVHRLLVGDCTDAANVARLMDGERAALCFTSPPYSDQREYGKNGDLSPEHLAQFISSSADHCDLYAVNLGISRKDNEIVTYWDVYISAARDAKLKLLSWNVWDQGQVGSVGKLTAMFPLEHEFIFVFGERRQALNLTVPNKDAGKVDRHVKDRQADGSTVLKGAIEIRSHRPIGTVSRVNPQLARNIDTSHPAMFPIELPVSYIEACADADETIYDPFLGSGTTLIAAHRTGRRCYGLELEPRYADVILKRAEAENLVCELISE